MLLFQNRPVRIAIVGAGVIGCAVAYELASRGANVTVIDDRGRGQGATRASAGVLAPYIEGHSDDLLRLGVASLRQYDGFIARVAGDAARPIEYRRSGTLQVARNRDEANELRQRAALLAAGRVQHALLSGEEIPGIESSLAPLTAALLIPDHGYVGVATLVRGLADSASKRGVVFVTSRVREITSGVGSALRVETPSEPLEADVVVIAAGSWSATIPVTPVAPPPVHPIRGQLLHLRFPAPPLSHVIWGTGAYLVPWSDGSVLVGATMEDAGFDESVTVPAVRYLLDGATELLPSAASAVFHEARAGLRPRTSDELPIIGASSTMRGVFYATGHFRNGVLLAPLTATMLADLILDGRACDELALVRPSRFGL